MLTILCLLATGTADPDTSSQRASREVIGSSTYFVSQDPVELERQVRRSFALTDKDQNGFIDVSEAPIAERGRSGANGDRIAEEASSGLWIRTMDQNSDERVEWSEMRDYLLPRIIRANADR